MWFFKILLILLVVGIAFRLLAFVSGLIFTGNKTFEGFIKGAKKHFLPSFITSLVLTGLCLIVQAPIVVIIVVFLASLIGTIFILLGNDEDNDKFRKL